jgi:hypothetical protein
MSLGPFEMIGPAASNRHGHFEPVPVNHFDMQLQRQVFGFHGDLPDSQAQLAEFLASDGKWELGRANPAPDAEFGRAVIRQLIESAEISGFKDPRVVLLWPYWSQVIGSFPGLNVVLLTLLRSPHEIAMSIFVRGKGQYTYHDALEVTAVNFRRIREICRGWKGRQARVRFDPQFYEQDLRKAAATCGLAWCQEAFGGVYKPAERHHDPARIVHPAQTVFDELSGQAGHAEDSNAMILSRDAALREKVLQSQLISSLERYEQTVRREIESLKKRADVVEKRLGFRVARRIREMVIQFRRRDQKKTA